ncbi:Protein of uncharacterised function (DUF3800) [Anaerococcus prevotii]|uniref:DUF3800 domain-containing protein n=1 Tax=Anaerococcus prevotii (strain ATCC 9321 / DSM 20548 / JCM 6508 / NCTC 11806 / PC1) TaxID=525919 RepID=C7RE57_ANAPD|nr:DUF3800 domain-containing protein [Anaerococcus prevotii]ACV29470.1 hypothetical protein Apre_1447 [Anaerococcus prevotii DSM 20548]SUU95142.1 Protein of uncharacterised function (DUF3800) [Anaerococcus prevotii]
MRYKFYYDESYHDPAITQKDGVQNIDLEDASVYFSLCIVGISSDKLEDFINEYTLLENRHKKKIGVNESDEIKGSTFRAKYFKWGLAGIKKDYLYFYNDLFKLLSTYDVIINISIINKFELLVQNLLEDNLKYSEIPWRNFVYAFSKFFNTHKTEKLVRLIHTDNVKASDVLCEINIILDDVIEKMQGYELKRYEVNIAKEIKYVLSNYKIKFNIRDKYQRNYTYSLSGFEDLMDELSISSYDIDLDIDGKGKRIDKVIMSAEALLPGAKITGVDSKQSQGIRVADFVSNLMGRLIRSIDKQLDLNRQEIEEEGDYNKLNLINENWFKVNKDEFECYRTIGKFFSDRSSQYWTTFTGVYNDEVLAVFTIFQYFSDFDDYEEYKKTPIKGHAKKINKIVVEKLREQFIIAGSYCE